MKGPVVRSEAAPATGVLSGLDCLDGKSLIGSGVALSGFNY
jgi:hypothetical protein